jgi:hypothetical protein
LAGAVLRGSEDVVLMVMRQMHRLWSVRPDRIVLVALGVGQDNDMLQVLFVYNSMYVTREQRKTKRCS